MFCLKTDVYSPGTIHDPSTGFKNGMILAGCLCIASGVVMFFTPLKWIFTHNKNPKPKTTEL